MPAEQALERLRAAVDSNQCIDPPGSSTDRRVRGCVTTDAIILWVHGAHLTTRRKSWNIEFRGRLGGSDVNTVLNGTIDTPDHGVMRRLMWLIRVVAALPLILATAMMLRDGITGWNVAGTIAPVAIAAAGLVGTIMMERAGEHSAADDARTLISFIWSELA